MTVAPVTRSIRSIPVEVLLDQEDGLPARCVANLDDLTTIPKGLIRERMTTLSVEKLREIEAAIRFALDLG